MYLSIPAAAKRLGYSANTLRRWVRKGRIRTYRATPTSQPRVKLAELEGVDEGRADARAPWG